jgi:integrase
MAVPLVERKGSTLEALGDGDGAPGVPLQPSPVHGRASPPAPRTGDCHILQNGAAVTDLQAILGHVNLATTQVYARMVDERMRASIRALDNGMGRTEGGKGGEAM